MIEPSAEIIQFQNSFTRTNKNDVFQEEGILTSVSTSTFTTSTVVSSARWVFISNILVAYWPFSVETSFPDRNNDKYLSFSLPSVGLVLSLLYIIFNVTYVIYYFLFRLSEEGKYMQLFDLILMTIWDLLVVVAVTTHRLYGLVKLSKFRVFWGKILQVVGQCTTLTSERDTELCLKQVKRWTIKWLVIFTALGLTDCLSVLYTNTVESPENALTVLLYVYLEVVICTHNSSALMLIYFIKVMTHGFYTCKRKLDQMSLTSTGTMTVAAAVESVLNNRAGDSSRLMPSVSLVDGVFKLIDEVEGCVDNFNKLFGFSLFLEAVLGFWQVMFAMYFLHENKIENVAFALNMLVPILVYPACLICLCIAASKLTVECQQMVQSLQGLPRSCISNQEGHKIQLLVSRLSSAPPSIQVAQLFHVGEPLLGSALNTLATYFIVLVQMKQITK